jgi:2Fe-2S ferredoxin
MPKVNIPQKNMTLDAEPGSSLMHTLLSAQIPVASSCDGEGICSMCRVQILATDSNSIVEPNDLEKGTLQRNNCEPGDRLSCQVLVTVDMSVRTKYW